MDNGFEITMTDQEISGLVDLEINLGLQKTIPIVQTLIAWQTKLVPRLL